MKYEAIASVNTEKFQECFGKYVDTGNHKNGEIGGVLLSIQFRDWYLSIPFAILAVLGFSLRFFHSKDNRQRLLSMLNAIIYESNC